MNVDRAVFAAYGRPEGIGEEEDIPKSLLALDLEKGCLKERPPGLKPR